MQRAIIALAALVMLCLGIVPAATEVATAAVPQGSITLRVYCIPKYNSVQILNDTDQDFDLRTWTITSLYQPGPDEPIALTGYLAPGGGATFFSGASKDRVLIGHDIFKPGQPGEGARLATPYGTLDVLCAAERGTLTFGPLPSLPNTGGGAAWTTSLGAAPPALTLAPSSGPCDRSVTASGTNYLPGSTVNVRGPFVPGTAINLASRSGVPQPVVTVGAEGTFTLSLLPCTAATEGADRPGTIYLWTAETAGPQRVFANAYFTVAPVALPSLPNTGGGAATRRSMARGVALALPPIVAACALIARRYSRKLRRVRGRML